MKLEGTPGDHLAQPPTQTKARRRLLGAASCQVLSVTKDRDSTTSDNLLLCLSALQNDWHPVTRHTDLIHGATRPLHLGPTFST